MAKNRYDSAAANIETIKKVEVKMKNEMIRWLYMNHLRTLVAPPYRRVRYRNYLVPPNLAAMLTLTS